MYSANTKEDQTSMLKEIGVSSFEELIRQIPEKFLNPAFKFNDKALDEMQILKRFEELASKNTPPLNFVGAGAYERYVPAAVKYISQRGEFLTAYTPYQAEASQGLLQTIYEYQSLVCALFEMDVSNASLYDGATSLAEAVKAAVRITGKKEIICSNLLNPEYEKTIRTYVNGSCLITKLNSPNGVCETNTLNEKLESGNIACVIVQNPNFLGIIEDMPKISEITRSKGVLFIACADPVSLGLLKPPGAYEADFAVGEGQSLGLPLNFGGPYLGIFTCKKKYLRQMPGRIVGMTKDKEGKRGFVLTIQAREQHIRRNRASSNICSNEALCALMAGIYLTLLGPKGLRELALLNHNNALAALDKLTKNQKIKLRFARPFFNEFVVDLGTETSLLRKKILKEENIDIGLPLGFMGEEFRNCLLVCATETKNEEDFERLAGALEKNL